MFEIVSADGPFLLARFEGVMDEDAMTDCVQGVRAFINQCIEKKVQAICVTDVREVAAFTPGAADVLVWLLRRDNTARTVNAFFARGGDSSNATEIADLLRQGQSDLRRAFTDEKELLAWIAPYLTSAYKASLLPFLHRKLVQVRPVRASLAAMKKPSGRREGA